jgi:hypothetical protein
MVKTVRINLDWKTDEYFRNTYTKNWRRLHPELTQYPDRYVMISKFYQLGNRTQKVDFKELPDGRMKVVYKYSTGIDRSNVMTREKAREVYRQLKSTGYYPKEYVIECYKLKTTQ